MELMWIGVQVEQQRRQGGEVDIFERRVL
jgi:hypothetical protein